MFPFHELERCSRYTSSGHVPCSWLLRSHPIPTLTAFQCFTTPGSPLFPNPSMREQEQGLRRWWAGDVSRSRASSVSRGRKSRSGCDTSRSRVRVPSWRRRADGTWSSCIWRTPQEASQRGVLSISHICCCLFFRDCVLLCFGRFGFHRKTKAESVVFSSKTNRKVFDC